MKYDLSILIPSRNEQFLANTVEDIIKNKRGKTEVIVGLDGEWADPPVVDHPDITILYYNQSIGQRALTNQLCRLSQAKWVMKVDAHCAFDEGFDVKIFEGIDENMTVIPKMYNFHVFDWRCKKCGNRWYQGRTPIHCQKGEHDINDACDGTEFEKVMVWKPRLNRENIFYRFDTNLHFQYDGQRKKSPDNNGDIVETMSAQGSCFMLTRKKYWELNICDEKHGSWGQQGTEVACKTWLSGGRLVTNKKTWYAHLFRTQGGDFGFPYPQEESKVEEARKYSKKLFLDNTWDKQIYSLAWLIKKFYPLNNPPKDGVPDWHSPEGKKMLDYVNKKGKEFVSRIK